MSRSFTITLAQGRLVFEPDGDRYAHLWEVVTSGGVRATLSSVEGGEVDAWPQSPPLQQVHLERTHSGQEIVLAVGMAGRSHWSASFELLDDGAALRAEIACRCWSAPRYLGSRYRLSCANADVPPELRVTPLVETTRFVWLANDAASELQIDASWSAITWPQTLQWRYRIEV